MEVISIRIQDIHMFINLILSLLLRFNIKKNYIFQSKCQMSLRMLLHVIKNVWNCCLEAYSVNANIFCLKIILLLACQIEIYVMSVIRQRLYLKMQKVHISTLQALNHMQIIIIGCSLYEVNTLPVHRLKLNRDYRKYSACNNNLYLVWKIMGANFSLGKQHNTC